MQEAARIRERLARLASETTQLTARLGELEARGPADRDGEWPAGPVINSSTPGDKIALFRSREDVFPRRWGNTRTGRAGYAPACGNERKPRLRGKPKVKCGACPKSGLPAPDGRSDRGALTRSPHDRRLSDPGGRHLPVPRGRLRREDMAAGRGGLSGSLSVEVDSGGTRTLALGQRRARLDPLRQPSAGLALPAASAPIF